jgi:hypothetical protein
MAAHHATVERSSSSTTFLLRVCAAFSGFGRLSDAN